MRERSDEERGRRVWPEPAGNRAEATPESEHRERGGDGAARNEPPAVGGRSAADAVHGRGASGAAPRHQHPQGAASQTSCRRQLHPSASRCYRRRLQPGRPRLERGVTTGGVARGDVCPLSESGQMRHGHPVAPPSRTATRGARRRPGRSAIRPRTERHRSRCPARGATRWQTVRLRPVVACYRAGQVRVSARTSRCGR